MVLRAVVTCFYAILTGLIVTLFCLAVRAPAPLSALASARGIVCGVLTHLCVESAAPAHAHTSVRGMCTHLYVERAHDCLGNVHTAVDGMPGFCSLLCVVNMRVLDATALSHARAEASARE